VAPFTHFRYSWVTISPKLNQKNYPIYDPGNVSDTYTRTESDYYLSVACSYNLMWSWEKFKLLLYPGIGIQNARIFKASDSISLNIDKPYIPGNDSLRSIKSTGFYPSVAPRSWVKIFSLPVMLYWKEGYGIDAGLGYKLQPGSNDFNAKLGFFFSLPTGTDGKTVTIEPLLKYDDDKSQTYARNFDKFSFGFSLSFAIPSYISGQ
jgi:hypothetical protein